MNDPSDRDRLHQFAALVASCRRAEDVWYAERTTGAFRTMKALQEQVDAQVRAILGEPDPAAGKQMEMFS
jgi:hypothetical protein